MTETAQRFSLPVGSVFLNFSRVFYVSIPRRFFNRKEVQWLYQEGANYFFPDYWDDYVALIPKVTCMYTFPFAIHATGVDKCTGIACENQDILRLAKFKFVSLAAD